MSLAPSAPGPLTANHQLTDFSCGVAVLDDWLRRRALANQASGASRTFVAADGQGRVLGYYALAAGAVSQRLTTGRVRRNMPEPIPVVVLARLAVDHRAQGVHLGAALLQDALKRALAVADNMGVRAMLVHALDERAKAFYQYYGFQVSPMDPLLLMQVLKPVENPGSPS